MDELATTIARTLAQYSRPVAAAWLFGSRITGHASPASDLDVAVLFVEDPPRTLDGMAFDLADAIEGHVGVPVDLVVLNRAPAELVHFVLSDGVLILEADPSRREAFEVRARREYFDLEPILDEYRRPREAAG